MSILNTEHSYGAVAKFLHWVMAVAIFGLFAMGLWMSDLDYQHSWYHTAPFIHKSIGVLLFLALLLRVFWRAVNPVPTTDYLKPIERTLAHWMHRALYLLIAVVAISGYFVATADGKAVDVFDLFSVPALVHMPGLEDFAGEVHEILAFTIIFCVAVHILAACKHHWFDKDNTLRRMLPGKDTST